ncbi:HPr(Ser) kinase/phosphatase [Clostridium malenominatum]|uniref:HPr kinase/phosphorylase n=1 Tax=Clostridium malenominatum TaxID=1539 RepID=A0ABN1IV78_9CLOT
MAIFVEDLIKDFKLEVLTKGKDNIEITINDINRPGLQFSGFYNYFANERVQLIGKAEWSFLDVMSTELRNKRLKKFFQFETPCVIVTRGLEPQKELLENANKYGRWVLRTETISTRFINKLTNYLDEKLAPETRLHGVLVDVHGIGILITGESGIGKSETALELIKRGHRLVADDAVDLKEIEGKILGKSPYVTSGMMEVRGMGIIDVPALYGLSSIVDTKTLGLVIHLEQWRGDKTYERLGIDIETTQILNVPIRKITLPIRPGRNIAIIIETAAVNYRHSITSDITPVDTITERINEEALRREKYGK